MGTDSDSDIVEDLARKAMTTPTMPSGSAARPSQTAARRLGALGTGSHW